MVSVIQLTIGQLEAGLDEIRSSPKNGGIVDLIVRRPQTLEREVLQEGVGGEGGEHQASPQCRRVARGAGV